MTRARDLADGTFANDLTVDTNTLHVDSTNNRVGVGTSSPAGLLSLEANNPNIRFDDNDTSNNGEITLDNTSLRIEVDEDNAVASSLIKFRVDGSEAMRIDSSGNVGIGTTSPSRSLHMKGSAPAVRFEDTDQSGVYHEIIENSGQLDIRADQGNTSTTGNMLFSVGGSEVMRIDSSGQVGIGSSSPEALLHVEGSSTGQMMFRNSGSSVNKWLVGKNSSADFSIGEDGTEWLYIVRDNGRVGIGQTPTTDQLEVNGDVRAVDFNATSDERLKSNIRKIEGALDKVCQMNGMHYVLDGKEASGVIAQNVQTVAPEAVADEGEYMTVAYNQLIGYLIEAVKELKTEVEELKNGNASRIS